MENSSTSSCEFPKYTYPCSYKSAVMGVDKIMADLDEQLKIIKNLLGMSGSYNQDWVVETLKSDLPARVEKLFLLIPWKKISPTYAGAMSVILGLIAQTHPKGRPYNYESGPDEDCLRQTHKSIIGLNGLAAKQKNNDFLVLPAQFGAVHAACSMADAKRSADSNEFLLGALTVGIMLLTHPKRLRHFNDLWIICAGDRFFPENRVKGDLIERPCYEFYDWRIRFSSGNFNKDEDGDIEDHYGFVTGFLV